LPRPCFRSSSGQAKLTEAADSVTAETFNLKDWQRKRPNV